MRMVGREHLLEQLGAASNLIGQRLKVVEKLLFARNQAKTHALTPHGSFEPCRTDEF